jgi:predicted alpha/beta-fold hydrolase
MPLKQDSFRPPLWLANRHVQTALNSVPPRRTWLRWRARQLLAAATAQVIECGDGVRLLAAIDKPGAAPNGRVVVMIHGWEGSADSGYMIGLAPVLVAAGYTVVRLNLRDHGDSHHLNRELFHSCRLQEVVDAVSWVHDSYPDQGLSLVGFSLGGNFCLRVGAAAEQAGINIDKIVAVCPVLNPAQTMQVLDSGWSGYRRYFLSRWRSSLQRKKALFPALYRYSNLSRFRSMEAMTDFFVREHTDYADLHTYLSGYGLSGNRLADISAATSLLLAQDDPVIPHAGLADMQLPDSVTVHAVRHGGHCGFMDSMQLRSWLDDFVLQELSG